MFYWFAGGCFRCNSVLCFFSCSERLGSCFKNENQRSSSLDRRIAPKFTRALEDVRIMPGQDVNLTCVAVGSPMPFVKWRQGGTEITTDDNLESIIGKNVLQLVDVKESKNYTCEASSDLGNIEHLVQVIVEGEWTLLLLRVCVWLFIDLRGYL